MKKFALILILFTIMQSCSIVDDGTERINDKLLYLEQSNIEQQESLEGLQVEVKKQTELIEKQSAKIDTLVSLNKQLVGIIQKNHTEDKGILNKIYQKISEIFD